MSHKKTKNSIESVMMLVFTMLGKFLRLFTLRVNRLSYLVATLLGILVAILLPMVSSLNNMESIILMLAVVLLLIIIFSLTIRRLHDIGLSGWFVLLFIIPLINIIGTLLLQILPGQKKANKYGSQPQPGINLKSLFGFGQ